MSHTHREMPACTSAQTGSYRPIRKNLASLSRQFAASANHRCMRDPSSDENTAERLSDRPGCLNEADEPSGGAMVTTSNPFPSYTNSMCQDLHTDPYFLFRRERVSA